MFAETSCLTFTHFMCAAYENSVAKGVSWMFPQLFCFKTCFYLKYFYIFCGNYKIKVSTRSLHNFVHFELIHNDKQHWTKFSAVFSLAQSHVASSKCSHTIINLVLCHMNATHKKLPPKHNRTWNLCSRELEKGKTEKGEVKHIRRQVVV